MRVTDCRICGGALGDDLILSLGQQPYAGVFPRPGEIVPTGPLDVLRCGRCGLVQLADQFPAEDMFGGAYGYRSGLNASMVRHLSEKARRLGVGDGLWVDIGSNDGTLLNAVGNGWTRVGFDPTAERFRGFYQPGVNPVGSLFSASLFRELYGSRKADVVTSIAMLYDLLDPCGFAREIGEILSDGGVWHCEVAYLPSILSANAFDGVCHEHAMYLRVQDLIRIGKAAGLSISRIELNDVNGGSIAVDFRRGGSSWSAEALARAENEYVLWALDEWQDRVEATRRDVLRAIEGKEVWALGASTKGNVLLSYCGIGPSAVSRAVDVNPEKAGRLTSTGIPIVGEDGSEPADGWLVLPWHFRDGFVARRGVAPLIFPLPRMEVV